MKKLSILPLLLIAFKLFSQQWYAAYVPHGRDVGTGQFLDPKHVVLGAGFEANDNFEDLLKSFDYAKQWNVYSTPAPTSNVKSMAFSDAQKGLAVHFKNKISRTVDGGETWDVVTRPTNLNFFKIIYNNHSDTWFIAGGSQSLDTAVILKSTDGGAVWNAVHEQPGSRLKSVYFLDAQKGFAVGEESLILATADGGNTWQTVTSPISGRSLNALTFINATTGYIAGGIRDTTRTILKTVDGGANWTVEIDEAGGGLNDITFLDQNEGYIVGDSATFWKTADGGQNWTPDSLPESYPGMSLNSITFYNNSLGLITGKAGKIYIYSNTALPDVITAGSNVLSPTQAVIRAKVNTHGIPAQCYFVVSDDSTFATNVQLHMRVYSTDSLQYITQEMRDLVPNTKYYYFAWVGHLAGNAFGEKDSFFTQAPSYVFESHWSGASLTSATLNGAVNNFPVPLNVFFDYGTDETTPNTIAANPPFINDNQWHYPTAELTNLQPYTRYYYRMRGVSGNDMYFSATYSFETGMPVSVFQTLSATDVTSSSAKLNGTVSGAKVPLTVYFDYGMSANSLDKRLYASPAQISDSLPYSVSANLTGLLPDTFYYYRIKVICQAGTYDGDISSFYTRNNFVFKTLSPASVTGYSAELRGEMNKVPKPVNLTFEWGERNYWGFQNSVSAYPASVNDTLQHTVSLPLSSLTPNTAYKYRLIGETSSGTFFGETVEFTTGSPADISMIQTMPATDVSGNSAQLNGTINKLNYPAAISFEYGTSPLFGNTVAATPAQVNDTLRHNISASLTGLQAGNIYYYRLKAETTFGMDFYGNTRTLYTGANSIPNWDFQHWEIDTIERPLGWNFPNKQFAKAPGVSGNALKISGSAFAMLGMMADIVIPGQAINYRPDSLSVHLNYSIELGDTAMVGLFMFNGSTPVAQDFHPVFGNSGGAFQRVAFEINYMSPLTPDSFTLAFSSSSPSTMEFIEYPNNYVTADNFAFVPSNVTVYNNDFEVWKTIVVEKPLSWTGPILLFDDTASYPELSVKRVLHKSPSDYAVEIATVPFHQYYISSEFRNGESKMFGSVAGSPVFTRPQSFNGYYRYYPAPNDTGRISCELVKQGQTIGWAELRIPDTVPDFTPFDIPISYNNTTDIPDTVIFDFRASFGSNASTGVSRLAVDKLSFDGFPQTPVETSLPKEPFIDGIRLYPNPANTNLTVEWESNTDETLYARLINMSGTVVKEIKSHSADKKLQMNIAGVPPGFYFLNITCSNKAYNKRVVVVK